MTSLIIDARSCIGLVELAVNLQVVHLEHLAFLLFLVIWSDGSSSTRSITAAIIITVTLTLNITVAIERGIAANAHLSKERIPFDDQITHFTIAVDNLDRLLYRLSHLFVKFVLCGHVRILQLCEESRD